MTYYVVFFMHLVTRRVHIADITPVVSKNTNELKTDAPGRFGL